MTEDVSLSSSKIMVLPQCRQKAVRVDGVHLVSLPFLAGACSSRCWGIEGAIRFLEVFPSRCCCLGGFGDIYLSSVTC